MKNDPPAREFMRRDVLTVLDTDTVWAVAQLFSTHGITGAPVVDKSGALVGLVSQTDIVRHLEEVAASFTNGTFYADADGEHRRPRRPLTAADLMNREVIHAPEDRRASELSREMLSRRIHRIVITQGGRVCGIVTTLDILKVL